MVLVSDLLPGWVSPQLGTTEEAMSVTARKGQKHHVTQTQASPFRGHLKLVSTFFLRNTCSRFSVHLLQSLEQLLGAFLVFPPKFVCLFVFQHPHVTTFTPFKTFPLFLFSWKTRNALSCWEAQ